MVDPKGILVTGAGGPAGIAVIENLASKSVATVGCDVNAYGAGLRLADSYEVVPPYTSAEYAQTLIGLALRHGADGLISTMTEELSILTEPEATALFESAGIATWFPPKADVDACMDKTKFAEQMEAANQPVPLSAWGDVESALAKVPGPWIVKPCFGRGSRDVHVADTPSDVRTAWDLVPDPILQTRLPGQEFTFDVLVGRDGVLCGGVPRFRLQTKAGISTVGRTFEAPGIFELTETFLSALGHTGPANVQGFIDTDGSMGFIEVNPRFSGALPLSLGAGADLVGQYVNGMYGNPIDFEALSYVPGTVMVRHFAEVFFTEEVDPLPAVRPITT